jgi:hypothetical protein
LARRGRRLLRILYWTGLSNLVVAAGLAWSLDYRPFVEVVEAFASQGKAASRADLPPFVFVTVAPGERKMALPVTVIARLDAGHAEAATEEFALIDTDNEVVSFAAAEDIAAEVMPVLRRSPSTGGLEIGNFKPQSFAGSATECMALGRSMIEDVGAASGTLEVLVESGPIAAARICAANGSVVITCRAGQVTISPRRARPDDKCKRSG